MKEFDEVFVDKTKYGTKLKTSDYKKCGKYPIIDQGQETIAGYTDAEDGVFKEVPVIIFGDHTRVIKYVDKPFFLGADGVKVLRSKYLDANYRYLFYALLNLKIPNTGYNRHFKWLKEAKIQYPTLKQQEKVVGILDKIEKVIAARNKQLNALDELIQARFVELFGDLKINSKDWKIVEFNKCASIDTHMVHDFAGYEDYPHIGIDSIEKGTGRLFGYRTIAEDGVISGKYLFTSRHIIYSKIRPNLNKVALPEFDGLCSADAYPILVKEGICNREYLGYTLKSKYFLEYILAFSNRTNLPKVNKSQVEGFRLPLPPIELQNQFADFVNQVDKSKLVIKTCCKYISIKYRCENKKQIQSQTDLVLAWVWWGWKNKGGSI